MTAREPVHPLIPADRVNGTTVFNPGGEKIGSIEDIAIDKISGEVAFAILSIGGFLGIGERYHPVPWKLLNYDTERQGYVLPCDRAQLEKAPTLDRSELSGWADVLPREALAGYYPYGLL